MPHFIEGVGDEIIWIFVLVLASLVIYLAWKSTGISPTEYYVWLVRMRLNPNLNTFQANSDTEARLFEPRLARRSQISGTTSVAQNSVATFQSADIEENGDFVPSASLPNRAETNEIEVGGPEVADDSNEGTPPESDGQALAENEGTENTQLTASFDFKRNTSVIATTNETNGEEEMEGSSTRIKLKFLDDTQIVATTSLETTVGEFKRRYFYDPLLAGKVVRLIYQGQLLRDDSRSLSSYGIHNECVLHCNVSSVPYAQPSSTTTSMLLLDYSFDSSIICKLSSTTSVAPPSQSPQTYHGRSIEDNPSDPYFLRIRNAMIRYFRFSYNFVMGPFPSNTEGRRDEVAAAAAAASRGLGERPEAASIGMYSAEFLVKFVLLWTFVYLYPQYTDRLSMIILSFLTGFFATIVFTSRRENRAEAQVT
ncbi:unnamed protein product [Enterobius vermicularis]|uniref:Ubiquitin-like domain-containing protein n=1 Tax=Enterobius vermicularis TaxID=51028 RepID=A0A0N4UY46_ENTVE|nr:unnamed protein product [Enterobius vermicularis]